MTMSLVAKLRKADDWFADRTIHAEAADRIEELEAAALSDEDKQKLVAIADRIDADPDDVYVVFGERGSDVIRRLAGGSTQGICKACSTPLRADGLCPMCESKIAAGL